MWRWIALALVAIAVVVFGFSLIDSSGGDNVSASAEFAGVSGDTSGYTRAIDAYDWNFPADFGAHPDFQTEWWYYTGNLADENGRSASAGAAQAWPGRQLIPVIIYGWKTGTFRRRMTKPTRQRSQPMRVVSP
jgi:predicted secreted hydrolase